MIDLHLRPLAGSAPVPLYHAPADGRLADRFARLVTGVWRSLPGGVSGGILEEWKYSATHWSEPEAAFALVHPPSRSVSPTGAPFASTDDSLFLFDADWIRRHTDEQVEAAVAHQLARVFLEHALGRGWWRRQRKDRRKAWLIEERQTDRQAEEWGFNIRSIRRWLGGRFVWTDRGTQAQSESVRRRRRARLGRANPTKPVMVTTTPRPDIRAGRAATSHPE